MSQTARKTNLLLCVLLCALLLCALFFTLSFSADGAEQTASATDALVATRADFATKLAIDSVIYVDDIDFGEGGLQVEITRSVTVIGKSGFSLFKHAYFFVRGSALESERIEVKFQNVKFDGCENTSELTVDSNKSFVGNFGDRNKLCCFYVTDFVDMKFYNCEFTRYFSRAGAVISIDQTVGNADLLRRVFFEMKSCKVYSNFGWRGVLHFNCKKNSTALFSDCEFYSNTAMSGIALYLGGVCADFNDCRFYGNKFVRYNSTDTNYVTGERYPSTAGGGAMYANNCDLTITDCRFESNEAYCGGALSLTNSISTVRNCLFRSNRARIGGAIRIATNETTPCYVTNSTFVSNSAQVGGGAIYVLLSDYVYRRHNSSDRIEFSFCSFGGNTSESGDALLINDTRTYDYYDKSDANWRYEDENGEFVYNIRKDGNGDLAFCDDAIEIQILGCFVIDDNFVAADGSHTYAASLQSAVEDGSLDGGVDFSALDVLMPKAGGGADVEVSPSDYALWAHGILAQLNKPLKIGASVSISSVVEDDGVSKAIAIIFFVLTAAIGAAALGTLICSKRRLFAKERMQVCTEAASTSLGGVSAAQSTPEPTTSDIERNEEQPPQSETAISRLTARETEVVELLLEGKTLKQVSTILVIQYDTAKTHCKNIYQKLEVNDRIALLRKYGANFPPRQKK